MASSTPSARQPSAFLATATTAELGRVNPRAIVASAWETDSRPEHVAFRNWVDAYASSPPTKRAALVAEGVRLAEARREALARLIVTDPEGALASAVPLAARNELPAEILARLETRVSGRGELALNAVTPAPGRLRPAETLFRSALIDGVEYRAHVYGRRADQLTVADSAVVGIAVDRELAVAESPVRIFEPGETAAGRSRVTACASCAAAPISTASVAYEYAGRVGVAENAAHFVSDAAALEAAERDMSESVNAADNQPGASGVTGRPARFWTHGVKSVLVIRVAFPDLTGVPVSDAADGLESAPVTEEHAVNVFTVADGVNDFIANSSYGKSSLAIRPAVGGDSPDVTPVLSLSRTAGSYAQAGDNAALHADARVAAEKAGFNLDGYDRIGVVFSKLSDIAGSRITYGGLGNIAGRYFWVNGAYNFRVITHELGHTYGIRHANLWQVDDGDPVSEYGVSVEYGDPFDIMGGGADFSSDDDFSHWNKALLQWLPDDAVTVVESAGVFRVHRFDHGSADLALPRALKIVRDPDRDYWIGHRGGANNASLDDGAYVLWGYNRNTTGDLLDLSTPGEDPFDAGLRVGATFHDAAAGITLHPVARGGEGAEAWIDVRVSFAPRVHWVSSYVLADEQSGKVALKLRRTGDSAGALSVQFTTTGDVAIAAADYAHVSGVVAWGDGDMADKTVVIPLVVDPVGAAPEGEERFFVNIDSVAGGVRVGPASASVTIVEPGARDSAYSVDFINNAVERVLPRADGSVLLAGTFFTVGRERRSGVARLGPDGLLDPAFAQGGGTSKTGTSSAPVSEIAVQADGRILIAGDFDAYDGVARGGFARLESDGTLDVAFRPAANGRVRAILPLPDGRVLVGGDFTRIGGVAREYLARLQPDGSVDTSFTGPDFADAAKWGVYGLAAQPDGKFLVGGLFYFAGSNRKSGLCRVQANGALDTSFNGVVQGAHAAGATNTLKVVRSIVVQPDGLILISGDFGAFNNSKRTGFARLTATGALDAGFNPTVNGTFGLKALLRQPDGRILVGGDFSKVNGVAAPHLARLQANGSLDAAFAAAGRPTSEVRDLAFSADGRLYLAGMHGDFQTEDAISPVWRALPGLAETAGVVEFSADTYVGREGSTATLVVHRRGGTAGAIRVGYATARDAHGGTAAAPADYARVSGVLEWGAGDFADKVISIPIAADALADEPETFTVRLGEPLIGGVSPGAHVEAVVTILAGVVTPQTIRFPAPADRVFGDAPFALAATSDSGLPVSFTVVSGPATLTGGVLKITGAGVVTVRASQAGDAVFTRAADVERSFTVARAAQTLAFATLPRRRLADGAFMLSANSDASLQVAFELVSGPAILAGSTLTPTGVGEVRVRAVQAGDADYLPAALERSFHFTVSAGIELSGLAQTYDDAPRVVIATTTPPDLSVAITYDGLPTPPRAAGTYQIRAVVDDPGGVGEANGTLVVAKATVVASVPSQDILFGTAAKPLVIGYSGLRGDDTAAGFVKPPVASHKVSKTSKAGVYPITLTAGQDPNYLFAPNLGVIRVVSLAGSYETLLRPAADAAPTGLLRITVASDNKKFSGYLEHADETARLNLSGTLSSATGGPDDVLGVATIKRSPKDLTSYVYRIDIAPMRTALAAELSRDGAAVSSGSGPLLIASASKARAGFVGRYTLRLREVSPTAANDVRPFASGAGHAVGSGAANGTLSLSGRFPEGSPLTLSLPAAATEDGDYRFFVRPHGARAMSYAAGRITDPRFAVELPSGGDALVWRKAAKAPAAKAEPFENGFALGGRTELRRWRPPVAAKKGVAAVPLATWLDLGVDATTGLAEFHVAHHDADLGGSGGTLPAGAMLGADGKIAGIGAQPNLWTMSVNKDTGAVSGGFRLSDSVVVTEGKPATLKKRTVKFLGVLRQPDPMLDAADDVDLGDGYFIVDPLLKGGASSFGVIRFAKPAPSSDPTSEEAAN